MVTIILDEEAVFKVACRIAVDDARAEYLQQVCGNDVELRTRVQTLLQAYFQQPTFLESSRTDGDFDGDFAPSPERVGSTLGPYKILEKIAEGGMGVVYVAEQSEPIRRKVALKVIRPGMAGKNVVARFEAERQALAMMNHPNIARVFDGGATDEQLPYFVMELVQGLPITEYCDQQRMNIRERLELFLDVCHAVQHAHQKGIIHRDLKPSNVLVGEIDDKAVSKVIDFGVAKAIHQPLTERSIHTQFSQMIGTPLYMSPEQAGLGVIDVDTRSDVYSLGVMLYEMLTGDTPFSRQALETATFDEMRRIIREQEPRRPSAMISTMEARAQTTIAEQRSIDSRKLRDSLRGELDWLVMKALEKDRARRYESVSALASDIQRYLSNEPMEAGPPSTAYRFKKFAQRNRGRLITASLLALMGLVGSTVVVGTKLDRDRKYRQMNQEVEQLLSVARASIDSGDLEVAQNRIGEAKGRANAAANMVPPLIAGQVEQLATEIDLRRSQQQQFVSFEQLAQTGMDGMSYDQNLGGDKLAMQALELYGVLSEDAWVDRLRASYLSAEQQSRVREMAYEALLVLADFQIRWGDKKQKERNAKICLSYLERAEAFHVPTRAFYWVRSECHKLLGNDVQANDDLTRFESTKANTAFDHYLPGHTAGWRGDLEEATRSYKAALRIQPDHFNSLYFLADRLISDGQISEGVQVWRACLALRPDHVPTLRNRSLFLQRLGEHEEALELVNKAIELKPESPTAYGVRGSEYLSQGEVDKALAEFSFGLALATAEGSTTDVSIASNLLISRAEVFYRMGESQMAIEDLGTALELARKMFWKDQFMSALSARVAVFMEMGEHDRALADVDEVLRWIETKPNAPVRISAEAHMLRGRILHDLGSYEEALMAIDKSLELLPNAKGIMAIQSHIARATSLFSLRQFADATNECDNVVVIANGELSFQDASRLNYIIWSIVKHPAVEHPGLASTAVELAKRVVEVIPDDTAVLNTLGVARYRVEDFEDAIESLEEAEELSPGQYSAYNGLFLAMAHAKLGRKAEAQQWYEKAVAWIDAHDADVELQRFRSEADQLLESLNMLPSVTDERELNQTSEDDTHADQPQTQPERSSEPVLETAGANPS